jgi:hypothetical protein
MAFGYGTWKYPESKYSENLFLMILWRFVTMGDLLHRSYVENCERRFGRWVYSCLQATYYATEGQQAPS